MRTIIHILLLIFTKLVNQPSKSSSVDRSFLIIIIKRSVFNMLKLFFLIWILVFNIIQITNDRIIIFFIFSADSERRLLLILILFFSWYSWPVINYFTWMKDWWKRFWFWFLARTEDRTWDFVWFVLYLNASVFLYFNAFLLLYLNASISLAWYTFIFLAHYTIISWMKLLLMLIDTISFCQFTSRTLDSIFIFILLFTSLTLFLILDTSLLIIFNAFILSFFWNFNTFFIASLTIILFYSILINWIFGIWYFTKYQMCLLLLHLMFFLRYRTCFSNQFSSFTLFSLFNCSN